MAKARRRAHQPTFYARSPGVAAENPAAPRGQAQIAILSYMRGRSEPVVDLTDMASRPAFRGMHLKTIMSAAEALKKKGVLTYDGKTLRLLAENPRGAAGSLLDPDFAERYRRGVSGAHENPVIRYSDQDILRLLRDTNRPAWERTAHITAAARQRGYSGDEKNQERMVRFLEASLEGVVPEGPGYEDASLRHARENPLDTSIEGWVHWHGDPPNEVGNLGPGQQVQTTDGWWYRQDQGADAGKLFFQAADPNGPVMLGPVELVPEVVESIPYAPIDAPVIDAEYIELPPEVYPEPTPEDLEAVRAAVERMGAVENPRIPRRHEDEMVKDPSLAPNAMASRYVKGLRLLGIAAQVSDSRTILPRGWDYGNITTVQVGGEPYEFRINVAQGEVSGIVSKGVGIGRTLGQARSNNANEVIGNLMSEASGEMRPRENPRRRGGDATAWRSTPEGHAKYQAARAEAQRKANEFGYDYGIEANDLFKTFSVMMLPRVENRAGYELRVEVVHPEHLTQTKAGHGPMARENPVSFQRGERLRIRSKGAQGQSFEAFWFTVPSPMSPEEVALQFSQTGQPGMLTEIVSGRLKWTYRQGLTAGQRTVTRVRGQ